MPSSLDWSGSYISGGMTLVKSLELHAGGSYTFTISDCSPFPYKIRGRWEDSGDTILLEEEAGSEDSNSLAGSFRKIWKEGNMYLIESHYEAGFVESEYFYFGAFLKGDRALLDSLQDRATENLMSSNAEVD
jgi:hypothetical protein